MKANFSALVFSTLTAALIAFPADAAIEMEAITTVAAEDAAETGLVARSYQFKHRDAVRAAVQIRSLVSARGSMSIQPATNTLVVTDLAANIKSISSAIEQFDTAPRNFIIDIRLVLVGKSANPAPVPDDLKDIAGKLSGNSFNSFEKVGEMRVEGKEGDPAFGEVKSRYRAEFKLSDYDPLSNTVRLTDLRVLRAEPARDGNVELLPILKTSMNVKIGQMSVLAAARTAQSTRALMIIVTARRAN